MERLPVDELLRLGNEAEVRAYLMAHPESLTRFLVEALRERVTQLIRSEVAQALRAAELTWVAAQVIDDPIGLVLAMRARKPGGLTDSMRKP